MEMNKNATPFVIASTLRDEAWKTDMGVNARSMKSHLYRVLIQENEELQGLAYE